MNGICAGVQEMNSVSETEVALCPGKKRERKHLERTYTETCPSPGQPRTPLLSKRFTDEEVDCRYAFLFFFLI